MRSQEKRLLKVEITRPDGYKRVGQILPEEKENLEGKGYKIKSLSAGEFSKKEKELKFKKRSKELKVEEIKTK